MLATHKQRATPTRLAQMGNFCPLQYCIQEYKWNRHMTFKGETTEESLSHARWLHLPEPEKQHFVQSYDCFIASFPVSLIWNRGDLSLNPVPKPWFQKINMTTFIRPLGGSQKFWTNASLFCCNQMLEESVVSNGVAENAIYLGPQGQGFLSAKCSIKVNLCSLSKILSDGSTSVSEENTRQVAN